MTSNKTHSTTRTPVPPLSAGEVVHANIPEMPTGPLLTRADTELAVRSLVLKLGALWLREHGPRNYGKSTLSAVTDAELASILAAAMAAEVTE